MPPRPSPSDVPSLVYLAAFAANSLAIVCASSSPFVVPLVLLQGLFFVGALEMTHQCVHHAFLVSSRRSNEFVGHLAASLIGFNLVAYRYFHLSHHRHVCDTDDPEGALYQDSPRTRWFALVAPIAHVYVAIGINRTAARYVPPQRRAAWRIARLGTWGVLLALAVWASLSPRTFLLAYLIPLALFAWFDFPFSQAEHYGAQIVSPDAARDVSLASLDVATPVLFSALMLHRNLHRVHHVWPRTRWFEAPERMKELDVVQPGRVLTLGAFARTWWDGGPRLWP